jgi:signal peptidase I
LYPLNEHTPLLNPVSAETLPRPRLQNRGITRALREIVETLALIAVIYAFVNLVSARFVVDGRSMEPNFETGQFLIVNRVNYMLGTPSRGDIIVFHYPRNVEQDYIKRVIGLPGESVELRNQQVYINGELLEEPYINEPCEPSRCRDDIWQLGEDEYFVMGDNRNHSQDSRVFGPVHEQFIVGEALLRYWPPDKIGLLTHLGYDSEE